HDEFLLPRHILIRTRNVPWIFATPAAALDEHPLMLLEDGMKILHRIGREENKSAGNDRRVVADAQAREFMRLPLKLAVLKSHAAHDHVLARENHSLAIFAKRCRRKDRTCSLA